MESQQMFEARYQMKLQSTVIESCFKDCINSFKEDKMTAGEKSCVGNCGTRYMQAFQEFGKTQQQMMQSQGGMGQF